MSILRDLTIKVEKYLETEEILVIIGARQAGKTTILRQLEKIVKEQGRLCYFLNLEDPDYLALLNQSPKNLFQIFPFDLSKRTFLLVDEVQYLNNPSNFLKYFFDEYQGRIKMVASGSSAFYLDRKFKDSLAGRKRLFYTLTLSFREFLRFKNEQELTVKDFSKLTLSEKEKINFYYQEYLLFGGYPRVVLSSLEEKERVLEDIVYSYIKKDVYEAEIRQEEIFYRLFKILASQVGNLLNSSELASTLGVSKTAIDNYLYVMQKSFHLRLARPFFKNLRKELTKMPKVYFLDLGLRNFLVKNFTNFSLRADKGIVLENAVYRQLLEKYDFEEIRFWRTTGQNEVDFILREEKALEVKADLKKIKKGKYKLFWENYPNLPFSFVTLGNKKDEWLGKKVFEPWKI